MDKRTVDKNLTELALGVEACMEKQLRLPALALLYSAIDITAWLANDDPNAGVGKRFMAWVDRYLLSAGTFHFCAADLYGGRCGMVHTLTSDSDMRDKGKVRRIAYAWGNRNAEDLHQLIVHYKMDTRYVAVGIEDLYAGWRSSLARFMEELDGDPKRAAGVYARAANFFDQDSTETIDRFIQALPPEK